MEESLVEKQVRLVLEQQVRKLIGIVTPHVPAGVGVMMWLADFGFKGNTAYCSTVDRESALKLVREWMDWMSPEPLSDARAALRSLVSAFDENPIPGQSIELIEAFNAARKAL